MTYQSLRPQAVAIARDPRPDRAEAEEAVRTLIRWAGDDPDRSGLRDTPRRVVEGYEEWFAGYETDAADVLDTTFDETDGYDQPVVLRKIGFHSHCEHHLALIQGTVDIAYVPNGKVVGISKLARLVGLVSARLQIQERLTQQLGNSILSGLHARGVAIAVTAEHACMTSRGVKAHAARMTTTYLNGLYETDTSLRQEFFSGIAHET